MVKESERRIWEKEKVSHELMTDESDISDVTIVRHSLSWRSKSKFILIASIECMQDTCIIVYYNTCIIFHSTKCFYGEAG